MRETQAPQVSSNVQKLPPKAFLSHSSVDKGFVEAVALRLGRVQVVFDKWNFETGDEFIKAIPATLSKSELFVLFASHASLDSFWVQLEIEHAQMLKASSVIRNALVFIIDSSISHADLPEWMQGALAQKAASPNAVARQIQSRLDMLRGIRQAEYFFGRDQLLQEFTQKLFPVSGSLPPNLLVMAGLSGMGRRTFAKRILEERMSLRMGANFHLRKGDGFDTLHLALLTEVSPLASKDQISDEIVAFRGATLGERVAELVRLFAIAAEGNVAPVVLDDGALIEANGGYTAEALALLRGLRAQPQVVVVFIQSRVPAMSSSAIESLGVAGTKISPLDSEASRQFLSRRFIDNAIVATPDQISNLVPSMSGYPPAFNMATSYTKEYGVSMLLNNKSVLTSFQQQEFADLLAALNMSNNEWGILRILSAGLEFPVEALMAATGQPATTIVPAVQRLVDLSLILNNRGVLAVAGPVTYAVIAAKGPIRAEEYAFIGKALKLEFWDKDPSIPDYSILEATISALLRGNESDLKDFKQFVVPSMLLRNAKYHYKLGGHDSWTKARDMIESLLRLDPKNGQAWPLLMKIQVRLRHWSEAEQTLSSVKELKLPEQHFLEGFLAWKRKRFAAAVSHFNTALTLKQEAPETFHALATCLFRLGKLDEAMKIIRRGLEGRARQSVLLVDLAASISIDKGELGEAEKYVETLRRLNAGEDYHHRQATLLNAKHKSGDALKHARIAAQTPRARFESVTTFINTLIEVKQFKEARQQLDQLDQNYKMEEDRTDVRLGLRCKYLLRQGLWKEAEPLWEGLSDKKSAVHGALRKEILTQKIADKNTSIAERNRASLELVSLKDAPALESVPVSQLTGTDDALLADGE
jgi:Tfp pilus assembly protein PilF